ncbi:MAG: HAMP domain-containing histidine kinase, partial [Arcobacter sp.]|nr:HAMP domain-containing histidine kinase [Arcobacter sp.]
IDAQVWHDNTIDSMHKIAINGIVVGYSRVILDASEFQEEVWKLKQDGIIYVVLAMIFGAFFSWLTVHTMTKQLVSLSEAASEVANGNLDINISPYKGEDEVARLTNDFHKMIIQLQKGILLSKLASLGEMIGHIAHQWRQPLSVISTIASGISFQKEMGLETEPQVIIKNMDTIMQQCTYLSKTIDDFRNFVKDEKVEANFHLVDIINKAIAIASPSLRSNNVELIADLSEDMEMIGYENELIQSLINIINNAKDALVENVDSQSERFIFIETRSDNDSFILDVKDNGGGIPANILPKIFDTYFTTKPKETGTGLGLSMVKKIITEHHNGKINVDNSKYEYDGKNYVGACFEIIFNK